VQLPSTNADYLNNPRPPYPALSRRLGEQGRVLVRVLIEADGRPSKVELQESSGYDRLDQTALQTVMRWRYVPGKRGDEPEAMWFSVPIQFVLE
jgi:periplasmic protein TonB